MCGIFGIIVNEGIEVQQRLLIQMTNLLFKLSEARGKEAAGVAIKSGDTIRLTKQPIPATQFIKSQPYQRIFNESDANVIIGHTRLMTDGTQTNNDNNHPVKKDMVVGVHNGIITNVDELWAKFVSWEREYNVDTELLLKMFEEFYKESKNYTKTITRIFSEIEGSVTVAIFHKTNLILATNTGSLYVCKDKLSKITVCASERYILSQLTTKFKSLFPGDIIHIKQNRFTIFNVGDKVVEIIDTSQKINLKKKGKQFEEVKLFDVPPSKLNLKRCTKCVLPETHPCISFDEKGVCNFCNAYVKPTLKGEQALSDQVEKYKSKSGTEDCIVTVSGGRDSTYGLHKIKEYGMNPVAFTYDWGVITPLARRNLARICGKLGVENIIVSADITKKREYIRKNIRAWLKKPDLGMVPIFMAGDKQFYYYYHKIRKQTGIKLVVFCGGNEFEGTSFKQGFCGVGGFKDKQPTNLSLIDKIKLVFYYIKQYITNPAYINSSIFDTLFAFYSMFILKDDYLYLYKYIPWDEKHIETTIKQEYNWEIAEDTTVTWRIGDGTAPFYNYIYYTVAGFSEFDEMRSNQIRAGVITREEALEMIDQDNKPRLKSLQWYAETIGFDLEEAINIINNIPKRWK